MSNHLSSVLLLTVLCTMSAAEILRANGPLYDVQENVLADDHDGFGNEEVKESNLRSKCYDEDTKMAYKVDSTWYPAGKCEKRICSRERDSKTPIIKAMECNKCTTCDLPNEICHPFKAEKNYPKCCPQCLSKTTILKKKMTKKNKNSLNSRYTFYSLK